MAWELRGKRQVYYRGRRVGQKVVKEYLGAGLVAQLAANADEAVREAKRKERAEIRRIEDEMRPLNDLMAELEAGVRLLTVGSLLAAGFHQHRGHWRRRRD